MEEIDNDLGQCVSKPAFGCYSLIKIIIIIMVNIYTGMSNLAKLV